MDSLVPILGGTLPLAATYAFIGMAWVIIFKTSRVLNFATGSFVVLGGYLYFAISSSAGLPTYVSLPLALILGAVMAALIYRGLVARLVGQPLFAPIILTFAIAIMLDRSVAMVWGAGPRSISLPVENAVYTAGGLIVTRYTVISWIAALLLFVTVIVLLRSTRLGLAMNAISENPVLASVHGIGIDRVIAISWGIAMLSASVAGITYGATNVLSLDLVGVGLRGIAPAFVGGLDSIPGVIVGAFAVAAVEVSAVMFLGGEARDAAAWLVVLGVLILRPSGLFGSREIARA